MYSRTLKEKTFVSWKVKLFCMTVLFSSSMCSTRVCEWKIIGEILEFSLKNKSRSHFLDEIFRPEYSGSLKLVSAEFEMQLIHVWGSPFKHPTTVCAKTVSSLRREST